MNKKILYPQVFTVTELITPEVASEYLKLNIGNRTLSLPRVRNFAQTILDDNFRHTHQGIAFDEYGVLVDGQHRLAGIVEAGKAVTMQVTRGVKSDSKIVIDSEMRVRNVADSLRIGGTADATKQGVAVCRLWMGLLGNTHPSIFEIKAFFDAHRDAIAFCMDAALNNNITKHASILTMVAMGAEHGHQDELQAWLDVVKSGETDGQAYKTSALRFRDYWLTNKHNGGFSARKDYCHRIYSSMIAWIERRGLSKLYAKERIEWLDKYKA